MISIIVPVYNTVQYLDRCIKSILNQTYKDIELILVDDGSKDGSSKICQEYAMKDGRIQYYYQDNHGVSSARNLGLKKITGDFLMFVDSDDWIENNTCEILMKYMEDGRKDIVVFNMKEHFDNKKNKNICCTCRIRNRKKKIFLKDIIVSDLKSGGGFIWNKLFRIRNRSAIPPFEDNLIAYEDKLWEIEYAQKMENIMLIPDLLYHYSVHDNGLSRSRDKKVRRLFDTIKAYERMEQVLLDKKLKRVAGTQKNKKKMQAAYSFYKEKIMLEKLAVLLIELRGNYKFIYFSPYIRISTKIKALYVSLYVDKLNRYFTNTQIN